MTIEQGNAAPGSPDDTYCLNCGQSRIAYARGGQVQECWVEAFTDEGVPTAESLRHRWPRYEAGR